MGAAKNPASVTIEVQRYRPEQEGEPTWESFDVPSQPEWMVLDALNHIKDRMDGSLSYRWACRMGVCGSCGMTVNGTPVLTCATYLADLPAGPVRVAPLDHFPVIRDLIVDIGDFMAKLVKVKPWVIRKQEKPLSEGEYLQTPEQLELYKQFSMCINCTLCYSACPIYPLEPEFVGPAAIALAQRYNLDSRDQGSRERSHVLSSQEGIWCCTFVGECSVVCPKHVDPAGAIQRAKVTSTLDWFRSLLVPGEEGMNARYTTYHPKWHRERMPIFWWLRRWNYTKFITRELTSLAVGYTAVLLVVQAGAALRGGDALARFEAWLRMPALLAFHGLVLAFLLIHTITWLNLAPRALVVRMAGRRVPDAAILTGHYVAWIAASAFVYFLVAGGR